MLWLFSLPQGMNPHVSASWSICMYAGNFGHSYNYILTAWSFFFMLAICSLFVLNLFEEKVRIIMMMCNTVSDVSNQDIGVAVWL